MINMLASFTAVHEIPVTPYTFIWSLPILLCISIIVKTIKPEVLNVPTLIKESLKLFASSTVVLILIGLILGLLLEFINGNLF
ncbi:MAG: hypothetical protein ACIAQZ_07060 [Sedimentisphaeraceae bacterium JB056]